MLQKGFHPFEVFVNEFLLVFFQFALILNPGM